MSLFMCVFALIYFEKIEEKFFPAEQAKQLVLIFQNSRIDIEALRNLIQANGLIVKNTDVSRVLEQKHLTVTFSVRAPPTVDIFLLIDKVKTFGQLEEFSLTD